MTTFLRVWYCHREHEGQDRRWRLWHSLPSDQCEIFFPGWVLGLQQFLHYVWNEETIWEGWNKFKQTFEVKYHFGYAISNLKNSRTKFKFNNLMKNLLWLKFQLMVLFDNHFTLSGFIIRVCLLPVFFQIMISIFTHKAELK